MVGQNKNVGKFIKGAFSVLKKKLYLEDAGYTHVQSLRI